MKLTKYMNSRSLREKVPVQSRNIIIIFIAILGIHVLYSIIVGVPYSRWPAYQLARDTTRFFGCYSLSCAPVDIFLTLMYLNAIAVALAYITQKAQS